jgi:hexosaminidase
MYGRAVLLLLSVTHVMALLFPEPTTLEQGSIVLGLNEDFKITWSSEYPFAKDLISAADRLKCTLLSNEHYYLSVSRGREFLDHNVGILPGIDIALIGSDHGSVASEMRKKAQSRRESYQLDVPADGSVARLTAESSLGAFRGLTTFEQLFYGIPVGSKVDGSGSATGSFINLFL